MILPNPGGKVRIGIVAGRSIGNAVERNRTKRRLCAALAPMLPLIQTGYDMIIISRSSILQADFEQIQEGFRSVLNRAGLLMQQGGVRDDCA